MMPYAILLVVIECLGFSSCHKLFAGKRMEMNLFL